MPWILPGIIISYLIGSIPTAYIFVRILKGEDVRRIGSGNVGATNASRIIGRKWGIVVLVLDVLKGFAAVTVLGAWLTPKVNLSPIMFQVILGAACISGHVWTLFLAFKGGKGVATTLGVLMALSVASPGLRPVLALTLLTWIVVFALTRIVSLASIVSCIGFPVFMAIFRQPPVLTVIFALLAAFIVLRHKSNLIRLFQKKEHRLF